MLPRYCVLKRGPRAVTFARDRRKYSLYSSGFPRISHKRPDFCVAFRGHVPLGRGLPISYKSERRILWPQQPMHYLEQIDIGGAIPDTPCQNVDQNVDLVRSVQRGDAAGMAELYEYISTGLRPYLARQLRSQDFHDKVHSIFVDVVVAIQRGQLREPHRLMGFARTIARRKVSGLHRRRRQQPPQSSRNRLGLLAGQPSRTLPRPL